MPRVVKADVDKIIDTQIADLDTFIETANLIVNEHLQGEISSEPLLTKIELYLAAHFVALTDEGGGIVRSSMGDAADSFANVYEAGLRSTRFGQQALALDYTSTLATITTGKIRAEFRVV